MKQFQSIILLAAGESRRFWPLSHKNLFLFMGEEVIRRQIGELIPLCDRLIIVVSETGKDEVAKIVDSFKKSNIEIIVQKGEGQIAALKSTYGKVKGEALILNSVDFFNFENLFSLIKQKSEVSDVVFSAKKIQEYIPGGYFKLSGHRVVAIVEKPDPAERPSDYFKLVADYFADFNDFSQFLDKAPNDKERGYEEALNGYIKDKKTTLIEYADFFYTLKYPWHVLDLSKFFLSKVKTHRGRGVQIADTAIISGEVYLADNVVVQEYAKIVGPVYIGKNSIIGNFTLIRDSIIGEDSLIGGFSEVTRSYLGNSVYLHRNYIGDSVVENNCLFGAGATTANFRFDGGAINSKIDGKKITTNLSKMGAIIGSKVKVGINASIMPGVKIAGNKFVSPGETIMEDIL